MQQDYKWLIQIVNQSLALFINALTTISNQWWEHSTAHTVLHPRGFSQSQCCDASLTDLKSQMKLWRKHCPLKKNNSERSIWTETRVLWLHTNYTTRERTGIPTLAVGCCSHHTVILPDWTLKKWGLSNFAFQHC